LWQHFNPLLRIVQAIDDNINGGIVTSMPASESLQAAPILVGGRRVGPGKPCLIVGEVAQSHDGSLGQAHNFIDAIASAGADAVKFQTHIAAYESTPGEPWRVKFSRQDASRYAYWQRMEFSPEQWAGLAEHARDRGLLFLSSPFSVEAVTLLERLGMPAWKVGSGEISNVPLFAALLDTGKPVLLSSGMSPLQELDRAVARVRERNVPLAVLQCTSQYPCPPEKIGLNVLEVLRSRYGVPVGLSDHSGTIFPALAAAALGVNLLEIHVCFSREMFGPDVSASVTTSELRQLVDGVRFIEAMLANPVDKESVPAEMAVLRATFMRSIVARTALTAGTVLAAEHLTAKKPATGISAERLPEVLGRRLLRDMVADEQLRESDLE
jgi:N-acetylneuraminate synthase